jgi:NAD(P)-dependent dehydrogenase (short-subunit alcohol dehydrogenase family)
MQIEGAVALVTGANRGLGDVFAQTLVDRGAMTVYGAARDRATITRAGVTPVQLDVTDPAMVDHVAEHHRDVTIVINNAGVVRRRTFLGAPTLEDARQEMETNYFGTLSMCRAFAPVLKANGGGAVVNVLSVVSFFNFPPNASQAASKAAAWSLTNGMRMELREQATLVVGVHAGFVDTGPEGMAAGVEAVKLAPENLVAQVLDAVEAGQEEVLADERTRKIKAALSRDLEMIYPEVERQWRSSSSR